MSFAHGVPFSPAVKADPTSIVVLLIFFDFLFGKGLPLCPGLINSAYIGWEGF
jgi:hypothetical protein